MWEHYRTERREPSEYDAERLPGSARAALFAQSPDHRGLGREASHREIFRWQVDSTLCDRVAATSFRCARGQPGRIDLPYETMRWCGWPHSCALQARHEGKPSHDHVKIAMSAGVSQL
jgi:hypothetical protein